MVDVGLDVHKLSISLAGLCGGKRDALAAYEGALKEAAKPCARSPYYSGRSTSPYLSNHVSVEEDAPRRRL